MVHCGHGCSHSDCLGGDRGGGRDGLYSSRLLEGPTLKVALGPANGRQASDQGRGPADRDQRGETAGAVAQSILAVFEVTQPLNFAPQMNGLLPRFYPSNRK